MEMHSVNPTVAAVELIDLDDSVEVFDVEVDQDHSFIVAGVVLHNSAICRSRDGKVYPIDSGPRPPAHFSCLPGDALILARHRITGASKRWFDGDVVVIKTAADRELVCTPNHPILTIDGWVAAQAINLGDKVICDGGGEWEALPNGHGNDMPASIHDVAEAFLCSGDVRAVPMPVAAEDFHGDGVGSKIAIVGTNSRLFDGGDPPAFKHFGERGFCRGDEPALPDLDGGGGAGKGIECSFSPATRRVSSGSQALSAIGIGVAHSDKLLLTPCSGGDSSVTEHTVDDACGSPEALCYTSDADARLEQHSRLIERDRHRRCGSRRPHHDAVLPQDARHHLLCDANAGGDLFRALAVGVGGDDGSVIQSVHIAADLAASCLQPRGYGDSRDADLARQIIAGSAGHVLIDQVVGIDRRNFSGHVYNLETDGGWYVAQGIIVHNCRSTVAPVTKSFREMGIDLNDLPEGTRPAVVNGLAGDVPGTETYQTWLKRQSRKFQDDVLGPTRGALFRDGGLTLDRFVDQDTGVQFTLDELRRREPEAFRNSKS